MTDELDDRLRRRVLWAMPTGLYVVGSRAGTGGPGPSGPSGPLGTSGPLGPPAGPEVPVDGDSKPTGIRWNLMTANLVVQVAITPKLVAVAIDVHALTNRLVRDGGCFALSLLAREDRAVVRRFVKPVPPDEVVAHGETVVSMAGEAVAVHVTGSPVLARAAAWLDCELRQVVPLGSHDLCIGEVMAVGGPEAGAEPPPVLRMEDTRMNYGG